MRLEGIPIPDKKYCHQTKPDSSKNLSFTPLFGHMDGYVNNILRPTLLRKVDISKVNKSILSYYPLQIAFALRVPMIIEDVIPKFDLKIINSTVWF